VRIFERQTELFPQSALQFTAHGFLNELAAVRLPPVDVLDDMAGNVTVIRSFGIGV